MVSLTLSLFYLQIIQWIRKITRQSQLCFQKLVRCLVSSPRCVLFSASPVRHVACVCEQEVQVWRPRFFWGLCWSACSSFSPWPRSSTSNAPTVSRTSSTAATKVNTWTLARQLAQLFQPCCFAAPPDSWHALFPHGWFDCQLEKLKFKQSFFVPFSSSVHFPTKWNSK